MKKLVFVVAFVLIAGAPLSSFADHSSGEGMEVHAVPAVSQETHEENSSDGCTISSDLKLGSRGEEVSCLQRHLIEDGFLRVSTPTGIFGELTKAAVMKWQEEHKVPATGYFGSLSRTAFLGHTGSTAGTSSHPYYDELEQSHKAMMEAFMNTSASDVSMAMSDTRKIIAVVLYNEFEPLDAIGPLEVLGQLPGYKVVTVAKQKGEIASAFGTKIVADYSFDELKHPAIIVVPGGLFGTIAASKDAETLAWLREADKTSEYTTSVCTGAWILGAAGLLNGRQASTHWTGADYLEDFGVKYTGKRYTVDGKYVTAAGVSAGIDMSFKLVAMIGGIDAAKVAQLGLEYDPQPPFDAGSPAKADPKLVQIMRDMMKDHMVAAQMMYGTSTTATTMSHDDVHAEEHAHTMLDVASWSAVPGVSIVAHKDAMSGWNLEITPTNFRFAPEHVNGVVLPNEGHAHLYINGKKIGRVYGNWVPLPKELFTAGGNHEILVTLNANDHSDLAYQGKRIEATAVVTIK